MVLIALTGCGHTPAQESVPPANGFRDPDLAASARVGLALSRRDFPKGAPFDAIQDKRDLYARRWFFQLDADQIKGEQQGDQLNEHVFLFIACWAQGRPRPPPGC